MTITNRVNNAGDGLPSIRRNQTADPLVHIALNDREYRYVALCGALRAEKNAATMRLANGAAVAPAIAHALKRSVCPRCAAFAAAGEDTGDLETVRARRKGPAGRPRSSSNGGTR